MYQTIVKAVMAHAIETPDKLAVGFKKNRITYSQLCRRMKSMAYLLRESCDVQKGDLVMLSGVSRPDYIVGYLAIQYLGAVSVPIEKAAKIENILDVYEYTQPKTVLADGKILSEEIRVHSLKELYTAAVEKEEMHQEISAVDRNDDEVAEILFTTGTTGKPKGTMLSVGNIYAITHNNRDGVGIQSADCELIPLPLNHSLGLRVLRTLLYVGATVVLQNGFAFIKEIEKNINDFECSGMVIVPASMEMIYRKMQDRFSEVMGKLRYIEVGAGSLGYDMKKKLTKVLPDTHIVNTWGSTETGGVIFLEVSKYPDKFTALGRPISIAKLKVVDSEGKEIQAKDIDTAGRMILQGPMQMAGYYNMPEATSQALIDGWLYTNDIVYMDEDGFVYMMGRADDIINVGGEKVSPIEVENIAQEYDGAVECACIGVDDPQGILGQVPVLYVVPESSGYNEEEFSKFLGGKMERYKLPQKYIIISELPRNRMKKLDRKALYKLWEMRAEEKL
ncbi:MAG: class I adenylate-forming enzyme family protein [Eubacteriales bacterium]|nr:class I adenylate-forming enzyme family protein [Eubacteriales bacterium]